MPTFVAANAPPLQTPRDFPAPRSTVKLLSASLVGTGNHSQRPNEKRPEVHTSGGHVWSISGKGILAQCRVGWSGFQSHPVVSRSLRWAISCKKSLPQLPLLEEKDLYPRISFWQEGIHRQRSRRGPPTSGSHTAEHQGWNTATEAPPACGTGLQPRQLDADSVPSLML